MVACLTCGARSDLRDACMVDAIAILPIGALAVVAAGTGHACSTAVDCSRWTDTDTRAARVRLTLVVC